MGLELVKDNITKTLDNLVKNATDVRGYIDRVAYKQYQDAQMKQWMTQGASEGKSWPSLNKNYEESKKKKYANYPGAGNKMLIATSRLLGSVVGPNGITPYGVSEHRKIVGDSYLEVHTAVPYAAKANEARDFMSFSSNTIKNIKLGFKQWVLNRRENYGS